MQLGAYSVVFLMNLLEVGRGFFSECLSISFVFLTIPFAVTSFGPFNYSAAGQSRSLRHQKCPHSILVSYFQSPGIVGINKVLLLPKFNQPTPPLHIIPGFT